VLLPQPQRTTHVRTVRRGIGCWMLDLLRMTERRTDRQTDR
jgi:hypothetical protein